MTVPPGGPSGPRRVVIVGGGIAGLACAARVVNEARARGIDTAPLVLEAAPRPGGVIATHRQDGFLLEDGPDCFATDKPWALRLCRRLGLEDELIGARASPRRSFVLRRGRLVPIPEGFQLLAPSRLLPFALSPILSVPGRLRCALDLVLPRGPARADESLASFVRRRFGREALDRLAQPLLAGIYNGDAETLSLRATMPRFLEMERAHRSVILALLRERRARRRAAGTGRGGEAAVAAGAGRAGESAGGEPAAGAPPADAADRGVSGARYGIFATLRGGMGGLVDRLVAGLPEGTLRTGVTVTGIRRDEFSGPGPGWMVTTAQGETIAAPAVTLAVAAGTSARLLHPLDPRLAALLNGIPYGGVTTVNLAWRRRDIRHPLDGFGFVVPAAEGRPIVACSFSSVKFEGRAPQDAALLRVFVRESAAGDPTDVAAGHVSEILGIAAPPLLRRACAHPRSMPQYTVGHLERVAEIESRVERHAGLALAGSALRGVGMPDCILGGEAAAVAMVGVLAGDILSPATAERRTP